MTNKLKIKVLTHNGAVMLRVYTYNKKFTPVKCVLVIAWALVPHAGYWHCGYVAVVHKGQREAHARTNL